MSMTNNLFVRYEGYGYLKILVININLSTLILCKNGLSIENTIFNIIYTLYSDYSELINDEFNSTSTVIYFLYEFQVTMLIKYNLNVILL